MANDIERRSIPRATVQLRSQLVVHQPIFVIYRHAIAEDVYSWASLTITGDSATNNRVDEYCMKGISSGFCRARHEPGAFKL